MKVIKEMTLIIGCLFLGLVIKEIFKIPIPETVLGMIVLFVFLVFKIVKLEDVNDTADVLSNNIAFWIAPSTVGIIEVFSQIAPILGKIVIIVFISTLITLLATFYTIKFVQGRIKNDIK